VVKETKPGSLQREGNGYPI